MTNEHHDFQCSFCNRRNSEVRRMIAGPKGVHICNNCVVQASAIIADEEAKDNNS